jgi:DNA-binding transcriptional regulator YiaG
MSSEEYWFPITGYEDEYQVSDRGRVRRNDRVMSLGVHRCGYMKLCLTKNGETKTFMVHRLVAESILGTPFKDGLVVNHKDGCKSNNFSSNLEWVTYKENTAHAIETGLFKQKGSKHYKAKLSESQVVDIKSLRQSGMMLKDLAAEFGVSMSTINSIAKGRTWKHA